MTARGAEQLRLETAPQPFHVNLAHEAIGIDVRPGVLQHGGERRGPALVVGLREERNGRQLFDTRVRRQLRRAGAAAHAERGEDNRGARSC